MNESLRSLARSHHVADLHFANALLAEVTNNLPVLSCARQRDCKTQLIAIIESVFDTCLERQHECLFSLH